MISMELSKLQFKAEELKNLACKACTKGWLQNHDNLSDPMEDINMCFDAGLISTKLKDRLVKEVLEINSSKI
tara:strand:+ start:2667 stop:2882 length:216 start_codon:yes stop_codon:yes gene_type:complete